MVVISIIALLSSVVLASLNAARDKARIAAGARFAQSAHSALGAESVALYNFEEGPGSTANDLSLNGNDGTVSGATYSPNTYHSGSRYALDFDGSNDFVSILHSDDQLLTTGFTISAWINPEGLGERNGVIVHKASDASSAGGYRFVVSNANDRVLFAINNGTNRYTADGAVPFDGKWKHVAVSVSPSARVTFYVNGAQSGVPGNTGALSGITTTNALCIGNRSGVGTCTTDRTFNGLIDDVRIYSQAFTASEIGRIYAEGAKERALAYE